MIIPLRTPDGLPDSGRLTEWIAVCDRCDRRCPLGKCDFDAWVMGQRTDGRVYYPPCVTAVAGELIERALRNGPLCYLAHAVVARLAGAAALVVAVALTCVAALLPWAWRVRVEELGRALPRRPFRPGGGR